MVVFVTVAAGASTPDQASVTGGAGPERSQKDAAATVCTDPAAMRTTVAAIGLTLCTARPINADETEIQAAAVTEAKVGGVAAQDGLEPEDLIYRVSDQPTPTAQAAAEQLQTVNASSDVVVNFYRDGHPYLVRLRLSSP